MANHYTSGKYVRIYSTSLYGKCLVFTCWQRTRFEQVVEPSCVVNFEKRSYRNTPNKFVFSLLHSKHFMLNLECTENTYVKFPYHRCCPTWNQCRGREVCSNGCYWPILCLSQQTVYVAGQTGGGAHGMVPQNKDCIIQSVQTILHSRLGAPEGL